MTDTQHGKHIGRIARGVAQAVAAVYAAVPPYQWRWDYAIGRQIVMRSRLTDPFFNNVDFHTVPGGYSPSTLYRRMHALGTNVTYQYPGNTDVLITADNVGKYHVNTSRSGSDYAVPVVTFGQANFLFTMNAAQLQKMAHLAPTSYSPWSSVPTTVMDVESSCREGEGYSESSLLEDEVVGFIKEQYEFVLGTMEIVGDGAGGGGRSFDDPLVKESTGAGPATARDVVWKPCPLCIGNPVYTGCNVCPECGTQLPTKADVEATKGKTTVFVKRKERRYDKTSRHRTHRVLLDDGGDSGVEMEVESASVHDVMPYQTVKTLALPIVCVNPNSRATIKLVQRQYFKLMGLRGFVDTDDQVSREWLYMITDEGAQLSDKETDERVVALLGLGHEEANAMQRLCRMNYALGGDRLATELGFTEKAGRIMMQEAKGPHKPWQLLMQYSRIAVARGFIRQYLHETGPDGSSVGDFVRWLRAHPRKIVADFYLLRELPGLACVRSGVRRYAPGGLGGDPTVHFRRFMAGRKVLAPVTWARHGTKYAPALLKETATLMHRMLQPVREQIVSFLSHEGQGWDWKQENANRRLKRNLPSANSETAWKVAGATLDMTEDVRTILEDASGAKDVDREIKVRTPVDLDPFIRKCEVIFFRARSFNSEAEGDDITPRGILPDILLAPTAATYYETGAELMKRALAEVIATPDEMRVPEITTKATLVAFGLDAGEDADDEDAGGGELTEEDEEELRRVENQGAMNALDDEGDEEE